MINFPTFLTFYLRICILGLTITTFYLKIGCLFHNQDSLSYCYNSKFGILHFIKAKSLVFIYLFFYFAEMGFHLPGPAVNRRVCCSGPENEITETGGLWGHEGGQTVQQVTAGKG